jgi:hypothetical protein
MLFHSFSCCICPTALASRCSRFVDCNFIFIGDLVLDILDKIQNQTIGNSDATSYKLTLLNFKILVVAVVTQFLLG